MKKEEFLKLLSCGHIKMTDLTATKGEEYSRDDDQLANFRRAAREAGIRPEQAWLVFFNKHVDAIKSYVLNTGPQPAPSEPIVGRIHDAILYLYLFEALLVDRGAEVVPHLSRNHPNADYKNHAYVCECGDY